MMTSRLLLNGLLACLAPLACAADLPATAPASATGRSTTQSAAKDLSSYILTPPSGEAPRINGPSRFGVRPGSPLLYNIPATGARPVRFSVDDLPPGLAIDKTTGRISGTLAKPGEYKVTLRAGNRKGIAAKPFTIVVGDEVALTPPMGWNSWNCWAVSVDQEKVLRSAHAMVDSGLANHGWSYINIDDAWQGARGGELHALQPNPKKFPNIKALCDEIHSLGLKPGIYSTPWVRSYGGGLGVTAENPEGNVQDWPGKLVRNRKVLPHAVGKYSFAEQDAKQFAAWGMDYLKYDWGPVEPPEAKVMADALRASGRDIVYSVSNNAAGNVIRVIDDLAPLVNAWRTTTDINDNWKRVSADIGFSQEKWSPYLRPGHYPDPDMLVLGYVGWGPKLHQTKLTADEQYTHVTLWCMLSAPLLIGCDLERLDPFTLSLLTNDEVLAIDQDALVKPAKRVRQENDIEVFTKQLEDGGLAVGLFNRGQASANISVSWTDLGTTGKKKVRDLWRQRDVDNTGAGIAIDVASHGAALFKVTDSR